MRGLRIGVAITIMLSAAVLPARAQQGTSEIGGKVTDTQGAVLPGVTIIVTNEDTGLFREVETGPGGIYFVSQMIPGRYRVAAKLEGFKALTAAASRSTSDKPRRSISPSRSASWPKRSP